MDFIAPGGANKSTFQTLGIEKEWICSPHTGQENLLYEPPVEKIMIHRILFKYTIQDCCRLHINFLELKIKFDIVFFISYSQK